MNRNKILAGCLIGFSVLLVVLFFVGIAQINDHTLQLLKQCMNDGHKEYECVGMINSHR